MNKNGGILFTGAAFSASGEQERGIFVHGVADGIIGSIAREMQIVDYQYFNEITFQKNRKVKRVRS